MKIVDLDLHRFQLHRFFLARQFVRRAAVNFLRGIGRRHLQKTADALRSEPFDFRAIDLRGRVRTERRAIGVVGVRGETEAERGVVAFAASHIKLRKARGAAEQQHQDAGRQRVQRAKMADLPEAHDAADGFHHIMRSPPARLVNDQSAVQRRGLRFSWHGEFVAQASACGGS